MQERDKEFAKAIDEIVKGIDEAFAKKSVHHHSPFKPKNSLVKMVINLLNVSR